MHLYDALWTLAAADLKARLENKKVSHVLAAAPPLEAVVSLPPSWPNFPEASNAHDID